MSVFHLKLEDLGRLKDVLMDGGFSLGKFVDEARDALRKAPSPEADGGDAGPFQGFRNPPSPIDDVEPTVRAGIAAIKEELTKRHGREYVDDLWERIQK